MALVVASVVVVYRDNQHRRLRTLVFAVSAAYMVSAQFMMTEWAASSLLWLVLGVGVGAATGWVSDETEPAPPTPGSCQSTFLRS